MYISSDNRQFGAWYPQHHTSQQYQQGRLLALAWALKWRGTVLVLRRWALRYHGARQHWMESWGLPGVSITNIWERVGLVVIVVIDNGTGAPLTFDARVEDHCSCPSRRKWNWVFWMPKWLRWTTGSGAATVDVQAPVQAPDSSRELALALKRLALRQEIDDWTLTKSTYTTV